MKTLALRTIPILGWIFLAYGALTQLRGHRLRHPLIRAAWWIDAFLSLIVHPAQIPAALRRADGHRSRPATAALTLIFGMTWWATQPEHSNDDEKRTR